jgi:hypothetical protein
MPDYDPKSIPILDDIIDDDNDNSDAEQVNPVIAESESEQAGNSPELSAAETSDISSNEISKVHITSMEIIDVETVDPEIADIDRFIIDSETIQSAQIDYHAEDLTEDFDETDIGSGDDISSDNVAAETVQPVALEALVDDVVKQLMPDLELQLRLHVLQALEEKLPAEIIAQFSADNDD